MHHLVKRWKIEIIIKLKPLKLSMKLDSALRKMSVYETNIQKVEFTPIQLSGLLDKQFLNVVLNINLLLNCFNFIIPKDYHEFILDVCHF